MISINYPDVNHVLSSPFFVRSSKPKSNKIFSWMKLYDMFKALQFVTMRVRKANRYKMLNIASFKGPLVCNKIVAYWYDHLL